MEQIILSACQLQDNSFSQSIGSPVSKSVSRNVSYFVCHFTAPSSELLPVSLIYRLDYGCCFINKIYKKNFKIANKSEDRHLRFQWSAHSNVVFTPSIGHLKSLTCKGIVATFLSSEPASYIDVISSNLHFANDRASPRHICVSTET